MSARLAEGSSIRWPRVLLGGAAGAAVAILSGLALSRLVLDQALQPPFDQRLSPLPSDSLFFLSLLLRAGFGFLVAWLYAAMRPRFGPGPATALRAAFFVWLSVRVYLGVVASNLGVYTPETTAIALLWALGEMGLVGLLAGALYREEEIPEPPG